MTSKTSLFNNIPYMGKLTELYRGADEETKARIEQLLMLYHQKNADHNIAEQISYDASQAYIKSIGESIQKGSQGQELEMLKAEQERTKQIVFDLFDDIETCRLEIKKMVYTSEELQQEKERIEYCKAMMEQENESDD